MALFYHPFVFAVDVSPFDSFAFVVQLFTFTKCNNHLNKTPGREEFYRYDRHALLFGCDELINLRAAGKELPSPCINAASICLPLLSKLHAKASVVEP